MAFITMWWWFYDTYNWYDIYKLNQVLRVPEKIVCSNRVKMQGKAPCYRFLNVSRIHVDIRIWFQDLQEEYHRFVWQQVVLYGHLLKTPCPSASVRCTLSQIMPPWSINNKFSTPVIKRLYPRLYLEKLMAPTEIVYPQHGPRSSD